MRELAGILLSFSLMWGQLPARYTLKADALAWVWRSYRLCGEYRLFRWAPPFQAHVERPRLEGLTGSVMMDYVRLLPVRGVIVRPGLRYYFREPRRAPHGLWVGLHLMGGLSGIRTEKGSFTAGVGLMVGYQHLFRQSYGGLIEPYLMAELRGKSLHWISPFQVGVSFGLASRRWRLRLTR